MTTWYIDPLHKQSQSDQKRRPRDPLRHQNRREPWRSPSCTRDGLRRVCWRAWRPGRSSGRRWSGIGAVRACGRRNQAGLVTSPNLQQILVRAADEAKRLRTKRFGRTPRAALLEDADAPVGKVFKSLGVTRDGLLKALVAVRGNQRVTSATPEQAYEALSKYGIDLVSEARRGKLDPVIGRDAEIRRVMRILSRKTKNNPVLIGEPGVGKTAIVEGWRSASCAARAEWLRDPPSSRSTWGSLLAGAEVPRRVRGTIEGGC